MPKVIEFLQSVLLSHFSLCTSSPHVLAPPTWDVSSCLQHAFFPSPIRLATKPQHWNTFTEWEMEWFYSKQQKHFDTISLIHPFIQVLCSMLFLCKCTHTNSSQQLGVNMLFHWLHFVSHLIPTFLFNPFTLLDFIFSCILDFYCALLLPTTLYAVYWTNK